MLLEVQAGNGGDGRVVDVAGGDRPAGRVGVGGHDLDEEGVVLHEGEESDLPVEL
mgnify:CR=1 FL=1